ncbi:MAG: EAL domain-containing protein, partial [Acidimicrobiales bacterium]
GPDCWFADATAVGLGDQLELLAVERALALLPLLPAELGLTVNVGPETLCTRALFERLEASTPGRITVELTEHVAIDISPKVRQARHTLRELGAKVAIDDTGTGFASLSLVLEMAPEVIKLDRALTSGIDFDPVRQALAQSLVGFAAGTGAEVVAEGIETEAELGVLTDMGVPYGQGYYLARPGSVEDLRRLVNRPQDVASLG